MVYQTVKLVLIPLQKASHIHHEPVIIFSQMFFLPRLHTVPPGRQQLQPAEVRILAQKLHRRIAHQPDAVHVVFLSPEADHIQHIGGGFLSVKE